MKKWMKQGVAVLVMMVMVCSFAIPTSAETQDVTDSTKKQVNKLMNQVQMYLSIVADGESHTMPKLNNVIKTNMICCSGKVLSYDDMGYSSNKAAIDQRVKDVFGNQSGISFKTKVNAMKGYSFNMNTVYTKTGDTIQFNGGDWGACSVYGKVTKVTKVSGKKYQAEYSTKVAYLDSQPVERKTTGKFLISLKKSKNAKYGYIITGIEMVENPSI